MRPFVVVVFFILSCVCIIIPAERDSCIFGCDNGDGGDEVADGGPTGESCDGGGSFLISEYRI